MKIYWFAAVVLVVLYLFLTFGKTGNKNTLIRLNRLAGLCGAGVLVLSFAVGAFLIVFRGGEVRSWAWDVYLGFYTVTIPFSAIVAAAVPISVFASRKGNGAGKLTRHLRIASVLALEIVLLILAPIFAALASNQVIPLYIPILISGAGESLCLRLLLLPDLTGQATTSQERSNP